MYNEQGRMYNSRSKQKVFDIRERSFQFGVSIVHFVRNFPRGIAEIAISNQLIRSGTSVGANIEESQNSPTKKDFIHGLTIALKEARETEYWLRIVSETKLNDNSETVALLTEANELVRILTTIIKKTKANAR